FSSEHRPMGIDRMRTLAVISAALWAAAGRALAHDRGVEQAISWTFDPWIVAPLIAFGALYVVGSLVLGRRCARHGSRNWQALAYGSGWLTLVACLVSPLHSLGEQLLSFHMIEHEIMMAISAALLVLANPVGPLLWGLPHRI